MAKSTVKTVSNRVWFKESVAKAPLPDLLSIQKDSFKELLETGLNEVVSEVSPITDHTGKRWKLELFDAVVKPSKTTYLEAHQKGTTYAAPWYVKAKLSWVGETNKKTAYSRTDEVYMGDIPLQTPRGTFIVNGVERAIINQLMKSEGVYFTQEADLTGELSLAAAKVLPKSGVWLEFSTSKTGVITVRLNRFRRLPATALLRFFGLTSDEAIKKAFEGLDLDKDYIQATLDKDPGKDLQGAIFEIFKRIRPGEPLVYDTAKSVIDDMFFNTRRYNLGDVGRFKLNQVLDLNSESPVLSLDDLVAVIRELMLLNAGKTSYSDIDHLGNRRVKSVGELVRQQLRAGFLLAEKNIREKMNMITPEDTPSAHQIISPRPIEARLHVFFSGGQLSQFHEQTNILSGLDHLRRLSVAGPGGLTEERASFAVRDTHYSQYGRICPIRTPEGQKIGLVTYLALYARVNKYGFLETPYLKLQKDPDGKVKVTDKVEYLPAYEEDKYSVCEAGLKLDSKGYILDELVSLRKKGELYLGSPSEASYIDLIPRQVVGASASLVPFIMHDDPARALMAANMQTQAVPLVLPTAPIVGTGMEKDIARYSACAVFADEAGTIHYVDSQKIELKGESGRIHTYYLYSFSRSNNDSEFTQRPVVELHQKVTEGELLADGPSMDNGEISLGANMLVAYMSWYGYGYEDAIILSERIVKEDVLSSVHIYEYDVQVMETKLGPEEITSDIPNVSEESLRHLDERGIVHVGARVTAGDILVGKIAPKGEVELSAEERLLRAIFGEKAKEVRDNSLKMPNGEYGTVIGIKEITKKENDELSPGVLREIVVKVAQLRKIMIGDKLAGRHGNKGLVSKIVPIEDMPYMEDGTPVDIIIPAINVIGRMNVGQILETHLGLAGKTLNRTYAVPVFEPFSEEFIFDELKQANYSETGKVKLIDGKTGEYFDQEVVVGYPTIMKLHHLSEDKIHARSTGPYSLITQQPLGGKAQFGGQRLGEMEVWALEAHSAAHILQEMLTIKSDDLIGRTRAYRAILQGLPVPEAGIPESFKLLVRELNGLGLDIEPINMIEDLEKTDDVFDIAGHGQLEQDIALLEEEALEDQLLEEESDEEPIIDLDIVEGEEE